MAEAKQTTSFRIIFNGDNGEITAILSRGAHPGARGSDNDPHRKLFEDALEQHIENRSLDVECEYCYSDIQVGCLESVIVLVPVLWEVCDNVALEARVDSSLGLDCYVHLADASPKVQGGINVREKYQHGLAESIDKAIGILSEARYVL